MAKLSSYINEGGAKRKPRKKSYGFKPTEIPDGFILKIDSREQRPLFGNVRTNPKGLAIVRDTVVHGDYTIQGMESLVAIERKGISDFFSYIGKESDRTTNKLRALASMKFAALLVEAEEDDLYNPSIPTKLTKEHVRGRLVSFRTRYGIHIYITSDRSALERFVLDHFVKMYTILRSPN